MMEKKRGKRKKSARRERCWTRHVICTWKVCVQVSGIAEESDKDSATESSGEIQAGGEGLEKDSVKDLGMRTLISCLIKRTSKGGILSW